MPARKTIVLYSPHFVSPAGRASRLYRAVPPLSHLALAGTLREAGYDVRILDASGIPTGGPRFIKSPTACFARASPR